MKIRIHDQTRSRTLYKLIYRGIFYPAFFLCACERSFETASFCLKFWLFSSCRPWKLILSIFSKSKRPFEKQITPRLITYLYLSMDKIWAKMIFWLWPRNFDFARFLQTFALKFSSSETKIELILTPSDRPFHSFFQLLTWTSSGKSVDMGKSTHKLVKLPNLIMIRLKRAKIQPPQIREILQTFVWLSQSMALVSFRRRLFRKNLGNLR